MNSCDFIQRQLPNYISQIGSTSRHSPPRGPGTTGPRLVLTAMTPLGALIESEDEYISPYNKMSPISQSHQIRQFQRISNKCNKTRSKIYKNKSSPHSSRAFFSFLVVFCTGPRKTSSLLLDNFGMRGQNLDRDGYIETIFLPFLQNSNGAQARPPLHRYKFFPVSASPVRQFPRTPPCAGENPHRARCGPRQKNQKNVRDRYPPSRARSSLD